jgi:multiple sugar transport system ATP-binding protein
VADFIGNPKVNLIDGVVKRNNLVDLGKFEIPVNTNGAIGEVVVSVRPEDVSISTQPIDGAVQFSAYAVLPSGADSTIVARLDELEITVKVMGISKIQMDEKIWLKFDPDCLNLYSKESGNLVASHN